jgi:hypothetical protein
MPIPNLNQSLHCINAPDKAIMGKSLTNKDKANPSITVSPFITEKINQLSNFSFQSPALTHPNKIKTQLTRPINPNPTQNQITSKKKNSDPENNPRELTHVPNQYPHEAMEIQTEKKRRREEDNKGIDGSSESNQHFLSAGPGSQACQE